MKLGDILILTVFAVAIVVGMMTLEKVRPVSGVIPSDGLREGGYDE